jgi:hypothetical protein
VAKHHLGSLPKGIVELYTHPTFSQLPDAINDRKNKHCRFLNGPCTKTSDKAGGQAIGTCSCASSSKVWVICPNRFLEDDIVFKDIARMVWPGHKDVHLMPELGIPGAGRVDYVLLKLGPNREILSYVGIEFVAVDTTGELVTAWKDAMSGKQAAQYAFAINSRNVAKRTVSQVLFKGRLFEIAGKYIIWVIQDSMWEALETLYDVDSLHQGLDPSRTTCFYIVSHQAMHGNAPLGFGQQPTSYRIGMADFRSATFAELLKAFEGKAGDISGFEENMRKALADAKGEDVHP